LNLTKSKYLKNVSKNIVYQIGRNKTQLNYKDGCKKDDGETTRQK